MRTDSDAFAAQFLIVYVSLRGGHRHKAARNVCGRYRIHYSSVISHAVCPKALPDVTV
jgi:hypothetical protein